MENYLSVLFFLFVLYFLKEKRKKEKREKNSYSRKCFFVHLQNVMVTNFLSKGNF